jgi:hypothetical protein
VVAIAGMRNYDSNEAYDVVSATFRKGWWTVTGAMMVDINVSLNKRHNHQTRLGCRTCLLS